MDINAWIEKRISGEEVEFPLKGQSTNIGDLSLKDAINGHISWVTNWKTALKNRDYEKFQPEMVCKDDQCYLGKWLCSIEDKLNQYSKYREVKDKHAQFHLLAADIITEHKKGQFAEALMRSRTELSDASRVVAHALVELQEEVNQK